MFQFPGSAQVSIVIVENNTPVQIHSGSKQWI
jgi:hypothetical protein